MKEFIIDNILATGIYKTKHDANQVRIVFDVELQENYFSNPYFCHNDSELKEEHFILIGFNTENKTIQVSKSGLVFQLSDQAYNLLIEKIKYYESQGKEVIISEEINFDKVNEYQLNDYRPVFFDLKYCVEQENIKDQILDLVHDSEPDANDELALLSKVDFYEYDIPDEFFKEKLFMHQNNFSRNSGFKDLSDLLLKYVNSKAVFNNHFLNHIDLFNKKLMVVKSKTEMIIEKLLEEENLSNNQFIVYMDGRSITSNNEQLMKEFAEENETLFDAMFTICKHSEVFFLLEKNTDNKFLIKGHYTDEHCPLTYGYMFVGKEKTMELIEDNQ